MQIIYIKLLNGQEIIADLINKFDNALTISNPLLVTRNQNNVNTLQRNQSTSYVFLNLLNPFSDDQIIDINLDHILFYKNVNKSYADYYNEVLEIFQERLSNADSNSLDFYDDLISKTIN